MRSPVTWTAAAFAAAMVVRVGMGCNSILGDFKPCKCATGVCDADGSCIECEPNEKRCDAASNTVQGCVDGKWQEQAVCVGQTCMSATCTGECAPSQTRCNPGNKNAVQACVDGHWTDQTPCDASSEVCIAGRCVTPPSCDGLPPTCGPSATESCCAITSVIGGTYNRVQSSQYPATVSDFRLDRFEITVGRFRRFAASFTGPPQAGAGAHPLITGSGWNGAWPWNSVDPEAAKTECVSVWTEQPDANENLPMTCMSWYEAFAFCAWDGGRLPIDAEWNYAAAGGNEQRVYPWGAHRRT